MTSSSRPAVLRALLGVSALALTTAGAGAFAAGNEPASVTPALTTPFTLVQDRDVEDRLAQPEDRYAVAGGCYTVEAPGQGYLVEDAGSLSVAPDASAAEPFHFQATRLGEYLLATNEGRDPAHEGAWWDVRDYLAAGSVAGLLADGSVVKAPEPSEAAEWRLTAAGADPDARSKQGQSYLLTNRADGTALTVTEGGLTLGEGTPLTLRHVADDDSSDSDANGTACATWPEIDTDASGRPAPVKGNPNQPVKGFFEAHVHGMAFEFLGGELRCGRPWHEYGVEYALGNCQDEKNPFNGVLEVPLGGNAPEYMATYDPQGWPTFKSWPQNRTLTHEQYYWRWLERAYLGGLRLTTNLLVDNEALCKLYPVKKNSCNEMDGVRLQAQRLFELQDYVDAQYGGPGEGWLRIVTSPAEARQAINAGRMALVLGIEISGLFDCTEYLDDPKCTSDQIDERLQEVFDMGVRQMELVNKFDNALSGVTGDGGSTGVVVSLGNRDVTGHWWDMQTCPEGTEHVHDDDLHAEHDKQQLSPTDLTGRAGSEDVDALAGRVLNQFGATTKGYVAPLYPAGPHCNSRGLTPLGRHLITKMVEKGMIFDPDHMSAAAQREALDLLEDRITPDERDEAKAQNRAAVVPAIMSSHSWGNEVTYQRIYEQGGVVAPRTDDAASFVDRWTTLTRYAAEQAPEGYDFGMGYGADTNGLGGQPGPRDQSKVSQQVDYSTPFTAPIGGVQLRQQSSGLRTFDINSEGVAQYGMFADWFHEIRLAAEQKSPGLGAEIIDDMLNGSEIYLGIWERAVYGANSCVTDGSMPQLNDLHAALGLNLDGFLTAIGQPADRDGAAYTYCAESKDGELVVVDVTFDEDGVARSVSASDSDLQVTDPATTAGHDHDGHGHGVTGLVDATLPADGSLALGVVLVLGLTGLGAGTLTGRYRRS